jgi:hypothetical protein
MDRACSTYGGRRRRRRDTYRVFVGKPEEKDHLKTQA